MFFAARVTKSYGIKIKYRCFGQADAIANLIKTVIETQDELAGNGEPRARIFFCRLLFRLFLFLNDFFFKLQN